MVLWTPTSLIDDESEDILKKLVQIKRQELKVSSLLGYSGESMYNESQPAEDSTRESPEGY